MVVIGKLDHTYPTSFTFRVGVHNWGEAPETHSERTTVLILVVLLDLWWIRVYNIQI